MAEPGLSEIITTTLRKRQKVLRDNITNNNAVLLSMEKQGSIVEEDGGRTIIEEMWYAENGTFIRYDGGQILNTSYNPTQTSSEFDWKQFAGAVVITGKEERMNAGSERSINLLDGRIKALEYTLKNNYNSDMLSNGTADGGKQIGGLALIISKTPTSGSVGGIDRSAASGAFYRNFKFNTTTDAPASGTATNVGNIKDYLTYCIINTTRGTDKVKMLLQGATHYRLLMGAMQSIQRIMDPAMAKAGFTGIEYEGIPCILGGGVSFGGESLVQDDLTYGLNTEFLKMRVHRDANMEPLPEVQSINQDSKVQITVFMGNMTASAPRLSFVMYDS